MAQASPVIGCIGLGAMGKPIAERLQKAGFQLVLYARRKEIFDHDCKALIDHGARIADTPADLASAVDIMLINVMAGPDVQDVLVNRNDAVIHGARAGLIIADHSTIDPKTAQDIYQKLIQKNLHFIDAPVSGGSIGAEAGSLVTMMGGDEGPINQLKSILPYYTKSQLHMGGSGTGQITKLCNQIAQIITIQGVAEAMQFAAAYGADQNAVLEVMRSGFASSRMLELLGPKMIAEDFSPLMKSQLLDKDAGIAQMAAQEKDISMPALDLVAGQIATLQDNGWQEKDISILIKAIGIKK